jgi:bifunctional UDP-N-acetylglucosamine pyrophosphorylase/glucosamine-1-phosphate N-acetyltransferase
VVARTQRVVARTQLRGGGDADLLILNADLPLLSAETLQALLDAHAESSAAVSILTCDLPDPHGYGRIARDSAGQVSAIVEESDADEETRRIREVNVGTYVFKASAFAEFYGKINRENAQGELYLTDLIAQAVRAGRTVTSVRAESVEEVAQVNSRTELAAASRILREGLLEQYMESGVSIDDPPTTYIEKGVRIGRDTRILPFTVICNGVEIGAGCQVGPFAHLRPGTRLADGASIGNFVEVKNSSIGRNSKARHLSYLGDGEIGENGNIGAGTIFANYDGKVKSKTQVGDRAFVGSGTILVAPVRVGEGAVTGAGSVVLKNRDVADGEIVVGVPARSIK